MLYVGEGPRGSKGTRSTLCWISVTPSATHNQIGPLWCWFTSGWACARPRPPWVSPTTSPVRLGVSPAAIPNPTDVFNQRFDALFPCAGALVPSICPGLSMHECGAEGSATCHTACPVLCHSESGPLGLSVCEWGSAGSASGQTACPVHPTLHQSRFCHGHVSPLHPGARLRPSYLSGCMFLFYLLGVGLPCLLIFSQFWLCEEVQCVYLRLHFGSPPSVFFTFLFKLLSECSM